jgi:tRNA U34 2-thiouridine synthase MnmA/TrmU
MRKIKALALLSGGLDSRLAVKMMLNQGIEVIALNFTTCFCNCTAKSSCRSEARKAVEEFGITLKVIDHTDVLLKAVKNPKYGYGRSVNPCIDCRIAMFKTAAEVMNEEGASFIITGEVLGERPMSQRLDAINIVERDSSLKGLILRPLSAKLFEPTDAEKQGIVDREQLLAISGRSRSPQIKLAEDLGVNDYPCPAGGCLLTDKHYARKLKAMLAINPSPTKKELNMLKVGRHFFIDEHLIVVGRNEQENERLNLLKETEDTVLMCAGFEGPTTIIKGNDISPEVLGKAAALTARYSKGRDEAEISVNCLNSESQTIIVKPSDGYQLIEELATEN